MHSTRGGIPTQKLEFKLSYSVFGFCISRMIELESNLGTSTRVKRQIWVLRLTYSAIWNHVSKNKSDSGSSSGIRILGFRLAPSNSSLPKFQAWVPDYLSLVPDTSSNHSYGRGYTGRDLATLLAVTMVSIVTWVDSNI